MASTGQEVAMCFQLQTKRLARFSPGLRYWKKGIYLHLLELTWEAVKRKERKRETHVSYSSINMCSTSKGSGKTVTPRLTFGNTREDPVGPRICSGWGCTNWMWRTFWVLRIVSFNVLGGRERQNLTKYSNHWAIPFSPIYSSFLIQKKPFLAQMVSLNRLYFKILLGEFASGLCQHLWDVV
jgi:hypothetical protein